jgi:hypothetical protein
VGSEDATVMRPDAIGSGNALGIYDSKLEFAANGKCKEQNLSSISLQIKISLNSSAIENRNFFN